MLFKLSCIIQLFKAFVDMLRGLKGARPIPGDADLLAFASLTLIIEYGACCREKNELIKLLNQCQALINDVDSSKYIPLDFILADTFPFLLSKALLENDDLVLKEGAAPYWLLSHGNSDLSNMRGCTWRYQIEVLIN